MKKSYQIVEPPSLEKLIGNPFQPVVGIAVLEWAIARLKTREPRLFEDIDVEVIAITYMGTYPGIGIHYKRENPDDVGPALSDAIDELIRGVSFTDFLSFVEVSNSSWNEKWQELQRDCDAD